MQVKEMMMTGFGEKENTILHWAAASGSKGVFEAILEALRSHLTRDEVPHAIANFLDLSFEMTQWGRVAQSNNFCAMALCKSVANPVPANLDVTTQIKGLICYSERRSGLMIDSERRFDGEESIMKCAAIGGDKDNWDAVLGQLELSLSRVEVTR